MEIDCKKEPVLIVGGDRLVSSVSVCLLDAGHPVTLFPDNGAEATKRINTHLTDMGKKRRDVVAFDNFRLIDRLSQKMNFSLAIVITDEDVSRKRFMVQQLEHVLPPDTLIAINTESIPLGLIQEDAVVPERVIGVNWVEPAHTTFFLEIISNDANRADLVNRLFSIAKKFWQKDPYVLQKGNGIRSRLMSALVREAFYLVENGYVDVEDIDRACRNDAGYYLPFAGNCRYMDLMWTYGYGIVMKDLNPDLSKDRHLPAFFAEIIQEGGKGMENNKGVYNYQQGEVERWQELFRKFSYQIQKIISKYPFCYKERSPATKEKTPSY